MKLSMKALAVTAGALAAVTVAAPAAQAETRFFGSSLDKLKDFIEVSAPVISKTSEAMGGPAFEGTDPIAAINGVTPMIATYENAAAPFVSSFSFGGSEEKADES